MCQEEKAPVEEDNERTKTRAWRSLRHRAGLSLDDIDETCRGLSAMLLEEEDEDRFDSEARLAIGICVEEGHEDVHRRLDHSRREL